MSEAKHTPDELAMAYEDGIYDALRVAATHIRVNRYYDAQEKPLEGQELHDALAQRIRSWTAQDIVAVSREIQRKRNRVYATPTYEELQAIAAAEKENQ